MFINNQHLLDANRVHEWNNIVNAKISQEYVNMHHNRNNYALKSIYDGENECINDTLSGWVSAT